MATSPRHKHDCERCVFLGSYENFDLYVCPASGERISTVVARYGDDGPDYVSGAHWPICFADEPEYFFPLKGSDAALTIALLRALKAGYKYKY